MKKKVQRPEPYADINVTPMVDVMLVLLIIFMDITPMLSKGISVDMVKTRNPIAMQAADKSDAVVDRCLPRRQDLPRHHAGPAGGLGPEGQGSDFFPARQDGLPERRSARQVRSSDGSSRQSAAPPVSTSRSVFLPSNCRTRANPRVRPAALAVDSKTDRIF